MYGSEEPKARLIEPPFHLEGAYVPQCRTCLKLSHLLPNPLPTFKTPLNKSKSSTIRLLLPLSLQGFPKLIRDLRDLFRGVP